MHCILTPTIVSRMFVADGYAGKYSLRVIYTLLVSISNDIQGDALAYVPGETLCEHYRFGAQLFYILTCSLGTLGARLVPGG